MNGNVTKLCDISTLTLPSELLECRIDESQIEENIRLLSLRYATKVEADFSQTGDTVICRADKQSYPDGRSILIYTGLDIPGAEQAAQAACGKKVGDSFATVLCEQKVTLTVDKVVRHIPAKIDDALISSLGIEGVCDLVAYRRYIGQKMLDDKRMELGKNAAHFIHQAMMEESSFSYDVDAFEQYLAENKESMAADYAEMGITFTEDDLRDDLLNSCKSGWLAEAFCQSRGITLDEEIIAQEIERTKEMYTLMGEEIPSQQRLEQETRIDAYNMAFFQYIDQLVKEKMEEHHGNA